MATVNAQTYIAELESFRFALREYLALLLLFFILACFALVKRKKSDWNHSFKNVKHSHIKLSMYTYLNSSRISSTSSRLRIFPSPPARFFPCDFLDLFSCIFIYLYIQIQIKNCNLKTYIFGTNIPATMPCAMVSLN